MKSHVKKMLLFAMTVMVFTVCLVFSASAEETEGYYTYEIINGTAKITYVDSEIKGGIYISVPETLGGYTVTAIGDRAYSGCRYLNYVSIGRNITYISPTAFKSCSGIKQLTVSENNRYYSSDDYGILFNKDKTELICYPQSAENIYTIPDSVITINEKAFMYCSNLEELTIGKNLTNILPSVFDDCTDLKSLTVDKNNKNFSSDDNGILYNKSKTELIRCPIENPIKTFTVPQKVTSIADSAFKFCNNLSEIIFSDSVATVGKSSFYKCTNLTNVQFGNGVEIIDQEAFKQCAALTNVTVPDSVITVGESAFEDCDSVVSVTIGKKVTKIGAAAFKDCDKIKSIVIPDSVKTIEESCFESCDALENAKIGNSVTTIEKMAFTLCSYLNSVDIPDSVLIIDEKAFAGCYSFKRLIIGEKIKNIGNSAFAGCTRLDSVNIKGNSETVIGEMAFANCYELSYVRVVNASYIGEEAFFSCKKLEIAMIGPGVADVNYRVFSTCVLLEHLYILLDEENQSKLTALPDLRHTSVKTITVPASVTTVAPKGVTVFREKMESITVYNPDCDFGSSSLVNKNCTITGFKGSTAEQFANKTGAKFVDLETVHEHEYKIVRNIEATCYEPGETLERCFCGKERYSTENAKGHTYKTTTVKATLTENGAIITKCSDCGYVKYEKRIHYVKYMTLSQTKYIYNGNNKTPKLTVKDADGKVLIKNVDYKISVASKRSGIGRYTVKVTLMGNYEGVQKLYFYVLPGKISKVKSDYQSTSEIKLSWSAVSGAAGYTVYRYSPARLKYIKVGTTEETTLVADKLYTATSYRFKVLAYGKAASTGKVYNSETYTSIETSTTTATPKITTNTAVHAIDRKAYVYHTDVKGETGYQLYYSRKKDSNFVKISNYKADTTRCGVPNVASGETYYFKIRTYIKTDSGYVYSPFSSVKAVKIK